MDGGGGASPAAASEDRQPAAMRKPMPAKKVSAQAAPVDKEKKRKERLGELKLELHKALLENLNLAALESASEQELRAEIIAISTEALEEMGVVLNRDERATLNQDLF
ncbi:MAG: CpaF family protein, partial [Pseudomonadota bacterium]